MGTRDGYCITNCDPFGRVYTSNLSEMSKWLVVADFSQSDDGARGIVEMLFCTSLIALVGAADRSINHHLAHGSCRLSIQK